jgi:hypothetical protein
VLLVCNNVIWRAKTFAGPWSKTWAPDLKPGQQVSMSGGGVCAGCPSGYKSGCDAQEHNTCSGVEDPYIWMDPRGNWHVLVHAYSNGHYNRSRCDGNRMLASPNPYLSVLT